MQNSSIHNLLHKGVTRIIDKENLEKKLTSGQKLVVKLGIDPVASKIHIGHMIPFMKLRQFQEMGHTAVLLFGDATAQVGDTSDKDAERPILTREETEAHAQAFLQKFSKVIDISKLEIYYNSEGLDAVNFAGVGELAKNFSVAEMLDRDNFSKRYKSGQRISLQEFLYPIMQGYDSVAIARKYGACDVELGGNDQYFNLLAGRTLMHAFGLPKQDIMTTELLIGTDGEKMSKSKPNCILIDDTPFDMYQKLINVRDDLILHYFELATDMTLEQVAEVKARLDAGEHPNKLKEELAQYIITMYHGKPYDASDKSNFEIELLDYYRYASILLKIEVINEDILLKANKLVQIDDFLPIIQYISGASDLEELKKIVGEVSFTKDGITYQEAIRVVMEGVGEVGYKSKNGDKYEGWIKRAKEVGLKLEQNLARVILFKELFELVTCFVGLESADDESEDKEKIKIGTLLKLIGFCATSGDVRNALAGKSVRVDGVVIEDAKHLVTITADGVLVEMGKKKAKRVTI